MRAKLVLAMMMMAALPARADTPKPAPPVVDAKAAARKHVDLADTAFKLGQFEQALAEYSAAYELFPVPALLFNIGQCHRYLKHYDQALFFYQGFLRDSPPDAPNRNVVEGLIKDTQRDLDAARAEDARRSSDEETQHRLAADEARRQADEAARRREEDRRIADARAKQAQPPAAVVDTPIYKKWWFWTAVGGALAVGGSAYYVFGTSVVEPTGSLGGLDRR